MFPECQSWSFQTVLINTLEIKVTVKLVTPLLIPMKQQKCVDILKSHILQGPIATRMIGFM